MVGPESHPNVKAAMAEASPNKIRVRLTHERRRSTKWVGTTLTLRPTQHRAKFRFRAQRGPNGLVGHLLEPSASIDAPAITSIADLVAAFRGLFGRFGTVLPLLRTSPADFGT